MEAGSKTIIILVILLSFYWNVSGQQEKQNEVIISNI